MTLWFSRGPKIEKNNRGPKIELLALEATATRPSGPHSKTPPVPCRLAYPDERVVPPSNYKTCCNARTKFLSNDMHEEGIYK